MSLSFIFLSKLYFMNSNRTHGSALNPDDSLPLALSQLQGLTLGPEPAALTVMTQRKKYIKCRKRKVTVPADYPRHPAS